MKIKYKFSILVIAIMTVVVTGIAVLLLLQASGISRNLSLRSIKYLSGHRAEYWKNREDSYIRVLRTLANIMADYEDMPAEIRRDQFDNILLGTLSAEPNLILVCSVWKPNAIDGMDQRHIGRTGSAPTGQYAMTYTRESGTITGQAYGNFEQAMDYLYSPDARKDRVDNPALRVVNGKARWSFMMTVPVISLRNNEVVGMVGCIVDLSLIQGVVESTIDTYDEITFMALYANDGRILGHTFPDRVGRKLEDAGREYGDNLQAVSQAVRDGMPYEGRMHDSNTDENLEFVLVSFQIGDSNTTWTMMLATLESYIMNEVNTITVYTVVITAIVILAVAVFIFIVLGRFTRQITIVADKLRDISEGEGDLTQTIPEKGNDEIAKMSRYFNQTLEKIKRLIISIKSEAGTLSDIGNDLAANMNETASSVNQIAATVQNIKGRILNQGASVSQTNATMEQVVSNINVLNGYVENQSTNIVQASSAIEEMIANINSVTATLFSNAGNVKTLMEASEAGRIGLSVVVEDIQEISRESEGLLEINAVMENISSQTNLLSMNAAIEAAHAGEAGKGFAVVADEIRKLAENSGEQSRTISDVLQKIKASIDDITLSTENVLNRFEAIDASVKIVTEQEGHIRNAMGEQDQGSKKILEGVSIVNEITRKVRNGSLEMHEGAQEVIRESSNLEKATQELTMGMNEVAAGAEQINIAVNHVNEISSRNSERIDILLKEVSRFKVQ